MLERNTPALKVVTQRELLLARLHQLMAIHPKSLSAGHRIIQAAQRANRAGIEARGVGYIEDLPGKA